MKYTIPVVTRLQDNGDGGYSLYAYNNNDELIADHPSSREFKEVDGEWQYVDIKLTQKEKCYILNEEDPYENGYISSDSIEIEIMEDGTIKLAGPLTFSLGQ